MRTYRHLLGLLVVFVVSSHAGLARGQGYGSDLQNVMAPASGGMAGVSTALPQDVPSAVFGNPATLAQFEGTQFTMGGGWVEGYPTVVHTPDGFIGTPFSATSRTEGAAATEIGVTQDLRSLGVAGTLGLGLAGISGGGAEYRGEAPGTLLNNESGEYLVLGINLGAGYQLTDRLSVGATMTLGTGFEQLGFVGPLTSSAMVNAYALRGSVGVDYKLTDCTTLGFYYQSKMSFTFEDAVSVLGSPTYRNINITQPTTFGWGVANRSLMNGDLLIAADVYYKLWEDAALWQDIMVNEWAVAVGSAAHARQHEIPPRLLLQQQPHQPQRGQQPRRHRHNRRRRTVVSSLLRAVRQSEPHHGRHWTAGFPLSRTRRRLVWRRPAAGQRQLRLPQHGLTGNVLRRPRPDLAL